ncbi:MAG TPA: beta-ureidopropionase [candidate division Zixibacteria bacterium]|nr:beta-ureidopropionase [candidate division Zixibacteria bacterium]
MKVAILQYYPEFGEVEKNLGRVANLTADVEADLFVLPELFATGYLFEDKNELSRYAETPGEGIIHKFLRKLAIDKNAAFIGGYPEVDGGKYYNSAIFVPPKGEIYNYRKIHLFDREKTMFEPGDRAFEVIEFRDVKLGIMICFDWIFPESYRTLALRGADLICHCTNLVLPFCQKASYAHAVSNRIFIALSNRIGAEKRAGTELDFTGQSIAYSPKGQILAEFDSEDEAVKTFEIDPEEARAKFVTERNHVLQDRRPEFYEI